MSEMSDQETVKVSPETAAKTFGQSMATAREARDTAIDRAQVAYRQSMNHLSRAVDDAFAAVRKVLGQGPRYKVVADMITMLYNDTTAGKIQALETARDTALEAADAAYNLVLDEADAFTKFVALRITGDYGASYADVFYEEMPLTFASLQDLARREGWCTDYEHAMRRAVREGALPGDTVELTRPVLWSNVPSQYSPLESDTWVRTQDIYAYARTTTSSGELRSWYSLREYLVGEPRYHRVGEQAEETGTEF